MAGQQFLPVYRPTIKRKDLEYVLNTMVADQVSYGEYAKNFEKKLFERTGSYNVIAVNSYFNALNLIFEVLGIGEGDEVIMPSWIPQIYLNVVQLRKAKPVLVDMVEGEFRPDEEQVRQSVSPNTKLLVLYYWFGYTYNPEPYSSFVPNILEDVTTVIGAKANGETVGTKNLFAVADFSYRSLITTGEGAAVFCNSRKSYHLIRSLIDDDTYNLEYSPRISCLMPDLNAAMGLSQIESLNHKLKLRDTIGHLYEQAIRQSRNTFVPIDDKCERYYSDFPIILKSSLKDAVAYLKKNKIEAVRPFAYPLHHYLNMPKDNFPATEHFYLKTILIPNYSSLSKADVTHITKIITTM